MRWMPSSLIRHGTKALLLALTLGLSGVTASTSKAAATPAEVKKAIEKGRAFLLSRQSPAGRWESADHRDGTKHDWQNMQGDAYGGYTALCTYALLASGEKPQDAKMVAAIDFLKKADIVGIYSIGMRCQVWYLLPQTPQNLVEMKKLWQRDLDAPGERHQLLGTQPRALGLWRRPRHNWLQ